MSRTTPQLTFEERPGYLYANVAAETIDRERALVYLTAVAAKCSELGHRRLMLERDIAQMLPPADLFFTTNDFIAMMSGRVIAFVNTHPEIADDMDFAMTIATNRGAEFRLFSSESRAEEWLLSQ